jgi:hypothetical protein
MNSRVKVADTVSTAREADNGLLVPCIKEPERVRIDQRADEGLLTPCVKEPDGLITPASSKQSVSGSSLRRVTAS